MDFVRKSIKAIGQTAVKIDVAAERCVNVLLDLIGTRVSYVVQEAVVVMKVGYFLLHPKSFTDSTTLPFRTFSENTHRLTKGLFLYYVLTLMNWMNQKQRHR